ncbi:unnamed protein product [Meloidogyne enterolobii]|uniref:Uncharacterized protein n=1 Tax=Meloidogyne enterolobii TaxID=390850 RepID=A0ACB0Y4A9_MELEN
MTDEEGQLNFDQIRAKFIHNESHEGNSHFRAKSLTPQVPIRNGERAMSNHSHSEDKLTPTRRAPDPPINNNNISPPIFFPIEEEKPHLEHIEEKGNYVKSVAERLDKMQLFRPIEQRRSEEIIVNDTNELRFSEAEIIQVADICDSDSEYSVLSYSTTNDTLVLNRRKSNPFESKEKLFAGILSEMMSKDNFKRLAIKSGLPSDVGTLRTSAKKKCRKVRASDPNRSCRENGECSRLVKSQTEPSQFPQKEEDKDEMKQKTISMASTNSSSIYSAEDSLSDLPEIPFYNTGDEKENDRLRQLHFIVAEFYKVERGFVELLQHIGVNYPKYLEECQRRNGYKWLTPSKGSHSPGDVITRITNHLQMILAVHEDFLNSFEIKLRKWDSTNPDFAEVFKNADYLKICNDFLKEKRTLTDEFIQYLKDNSELALATRTFEQEGFTEQHKNNNNKINKLIKNNINKHYIALQLDKVHQNIVQYKSQMERYKKYLPQNCVEAELADKALRKLEDVSSGVNQYLVGADNNELLELHRRLQGSFDVFEPGRKLLHKGELLRYTRKTPQPRYLVLFSDFLLICKYPSIGDAFEKFHKIKVEDIQLNIKDHVDYEIEFTLISPQKSSSFGAKDKRERDVWVQRISEAKTKFLFLTKLNNNNSLNDRRNLLENGNGEVEEVEKSSKIEFSSAAPEWMRDSKTTKCLIVGCETKFNLVKRRHHCRACGWIICGKCVGYAPVVNLEWERDIVCPECFEKTVIAFERGTLFTSQKVRVIKTDDETELPENCLKKYSINDISLRIFYENGSRLLPLSKLFIMSKNGIRKKIIVKEMVSIDNSFPSGIVFLRNSRGIVLQRWARLLDQFCLNFYEAEFDDKPSESYFIYGYSVTSKETEKDGTVIELTHHNQIKTERKGDEIIFCVRHPGSATNWLNALNEMLEIDA